MGLVEQFLGVALLNAILGSEFLLKLTFVGGVIAKPIDLFRGAVGSISVQRTV